MKGSICYASLRFFIMMFLGSKPKIKKIVYKMKNVEFEVDVEASRFTYSHIGKYPTHK